jgi:hypothetical protein
MFRAISGENLPIRPGQSTICRKKLPFLVNCSGASGARNLRGGPKRADSVESRRRWNRGSGNSPRVGSGRLSGEGLGMGRLRVDSGY